MKKRIISTLIISLALVGCSKESPEPTPAKEPIVEEQKEEVIEPVVKGDFSPTTGLPITNQKNQSFSVMIENSKPARPHTGLVNADVVYEMKVEYDITRYLAFYHDDIPEKIGPVRSARHYFLPLASDVNIPYIHYGWSEQAYIDLKKMKQTHIDGTADGYKYFQRDSSRKAPHNAYLQPNKLPSFSEQLFEMPFSFLSEEKNSGVTVNNLSFSYNTFTNIEYHYDEKSNRYTRYLDGNVQSDRETKKPIEVSNIIIMKAKHTNLHDEANHIDIDFVSGGTISYYTNGTKQEGVWKNMNGDIQYLDGNGEKIALQSGKTWIQVVDDSILVNEK